MELIVVLVILALIVIFFRDCKSVIYGLGIIEIFLRIMAFIKNNIGIKPISDIIGKYLPNSILDIFAKYSTGLFYQILMWGFVLCMIWFLIYLIKYLIGRK